MKMTIGKRLREYISERNLSQEEFSALSKISKQTVNNIIQDRNAPSGDVLVKIAAEYKDLNLNWLVTGNGNKFNSQANTTNNSTIYTDDLSRESLLILVTEKDKIISNQKEMIDSLKDSMDFQRQLIRKKM